MQALDYSLYITLGLFECGFYLRVASIFYFINILRGFYSRAASVQENTVSCKGPCHLIMLWHNIVSIYNEDLMLHIILANQAF